MSEKRTTSTRNSTEDEINDASPISSDNNYSVITKPKKADLGSKKFKTNQINSRKENKDKPIERSNINLHRNFNFNNYIFKVNSELNNCVGEIKKNYQDKSKINL